MKNRLKKKLILLTTSTSFSIWIKNQYICATIVAKNLIPENYIKIKNYNLTLHNQSRSFNQCCGSFSGKSPMPNYVR